MTPFETNVQTPPFVTQADTPHVQHLMSLRSLFVGQSRHAFERELEVERAQASEPQATEAILAALDCLWPDARPAQRDSAAIRAALFTHAALMGLSRLGASKANALERTASQFRCSEADVLAELDVRHEVEPKVAPRPNGVTHTAVIAQANDLILNRILDSSIHLHAELPTSALSVLRDAKARGLMVLARTGLPSHAAPAFHDGGGGMESPPQIEARTREQSKAPSLTLDLAGPALLTEPQQKYAAALRQWVPYVLWTPRFTLHATVRTPLGTQLYAVKAGAPLSLGRLTRRPEIKALSTLIADLRAHRGTWHVELEPERIVCGAHVFLPDLRLTHQATGRSVTCEWLGPWTRSFLEMRHSVVTAAAHPEPCLALVNHAQGQDEPSSHARPLPSAIAYAGTLTAAGLLDALRERLEL